MLIHRDPRTPPPSAESTRHILLTGGTEGEEKSECYFIKLQVLFCSFCFVSREARSLWSREYELITSPPPFFLGY